MESQFDPDREFVPVSPHQATYPAIPQEPRVGPTGLVELVQVGQGHEPQRLEPEQPGFDTAFMGDCVSMVACWDAGDGDYQIMIGQHGSGGYQALNLQAFANQITANGTMPIREDLRIMVLPGACHKNPEWIHQKGRERFLKQMPQHLFKAQPQGDTAMSLVAIAAKIEILQPSQLFQIDRSGQVRAKEYIPLENRLPRKVSSVGYAVVNLQPSSVPVQDADAHKKNSNSNTVGDGYVRRPVKAPKNSHSYGGPGEY